MNTIADWERVYSLGLYQERLLGNERFENGFMGSITSEERFIGKQDRTMLQMRIKMPCQVLCMYDVSEMSSQQSSELFCCHTLTGAFLTSQNDGHLALLIGMLYAISHPVQQVFRILSFAGADVIAQVLKI